MSNGSVKTLLWSFLEQGGPKLVSLVTQIVLARILTPEAFGILAILLVVTNIADAIAQCGFGSAIIQGKQTNKTAISTAFWLSMIMAFLLFVAILLISALIEGFYGMPGLRTYLNALAIVVLINSANSILRSILQRNLEFRSLFFASMISAIVSGVIGICAALMGLGVWALIIQSITQSAASGLMMAFRVDWRPTLRFDRNEAKLLFTYGWKIAVTSIVNTVYTGISDLVVGKTCSATALGFYSQGRKYPMAVILMASNAIQNVLFPVLARRQDDIDALKRAAKRALVTGTFIIAPLALFCASAAEPIVALLLTEKWLPCVPIFQMVCISHAVMGMTMVNPRAYMALGRSDIYLRVHILKVAIGVVAICGTAVAARDIYAVAFATCVSTLFNTLFVDAAYAKNLYGYSIVEQLFDVGPLVILSLVASLVSYVPSLLMDNYLGMFVVQAVLYWGLYFAVSQVLNIQGFVDFVNIVKSFFHRREDRIVK